MTGLCTSNDFGGSVVVTARSAARSGRLAARFASRVRVVPGVQSAIDASDVVVVSVLPGQVAEVLGNAAFAPRHTVLSVAAGIPVATLAGLVEPATRVHRAIPMPPVELGVGPLPLFPPSPELESLLATIGTVVPVDDERQFQALAAASAVMASFFETVATTARWLEGETVPADGAARYATSLFEALTQLLRGADPAQLAGMSAECLTAGGLNEQVLTELREHDWFDVLAKRLDRVMAPH